MERHLTVGIEHTLENVPVLIQPGQAIRTGLAYGYGRTHSKEVNNMELTHSDWFDNSFSTFL